MRWPRGRWNGQRIQGAKIILSLHLLNWHWRPKASRNWGMPYVIWLCFTLRAEALYE